jgi:hypothetical protein
MRQGLIVTQPGLNQRWVIDEELVPVIGKANNTWYFPKADDYRGLIYRHTHSEYLYYHPDGRIFKAWLTR